MTHQMNDLVGTGNGKSAVCNDIISRFLDTAAAEGVDVIHVVESWKQGGEFDELRLVLDEGQLGEPDDKMVEEMQAMLRCMRDERADMQVLR
jgi:hypothetical protein